MTLSTKQESKKMKLENAIKKLENAGYKVSQVSTSNTYNATMGRKVIEFLISGGKVYGCTVRDKKDQHDVQHDYHAGVYCANISQAMRMN